MSCMLLTTICVWSVVQEGQFRIFIAFQKSVCDIYMHLSRQYSHLFHSVIPHLAAYVHCCLFVIPFSLSYFGVWLFTIVYLQMFEGKHMSWTMIYIYFCYFYLYLFKLFKLVDMMPWLIYCQLKVTFIQHVDAYAARHVPHNWHSRCHSVPEKRHPMSNVSDDYVNTATSDRDGVRLSWSDAPRSSGMLHCQSGIVANWHRHTGRETV